MDENTQETNLFGIIKKPEIEYKHYFDRLGLGLGFELQLGDQLQVSNWHMTKITDELWITNQYCMNKINNTLNILNLPKLTNIRDLGALIK